MRSPGAVALRVMDAMGDAEVLDRAVAGLMAASEHALGGKAVSAAHGRGGRAAQRWARFWEGTWLGHSLHPLLSDFVEGPWMAASFLDVFGPEGSAPAAERLLGFGLFVAVPCYLAGLADWRQASEPGDRRVGLIHLVAVSLATGLYGLSYAARRTGRHRKGALLGLAGGSVAMVDGYIGGHLSHVRGVAGGCHA